VKVRCLILMKKQFIIWLLILLATSLLIRASREWVYEPVKVEAEVDELGMLIDQLAMCESSGRTDIKILDSNNLHSYGLLQFQEATFIGYTKKYNLRPEMEDQEIMNEIYNGDYQKELARKILEEPSGWKNWFNCGRRIGLDNNANIL